jgi:hypothetical protein
MTMSGGDRSHRVNPSERGTDCWSEVNWGAQLADFKQMQYHQSLLWLALVELLVEKGVVTREEVREAARELDREVTAVPNRKEEEAEGQALPSRREEEKEE